MRFVYPSTKMASLVAMILVTSTIWVDGQPLICEQRDLRKLGVRINLLTVQTDKTEGALRANLQGTKLNTTNLIKNLNATFRNTIDETDHASSHLNSAVTRLSNLIFESRRNINASIKVTQERLSTLYDYLQGIALGTDTMRSTIEEVKGEIRYVREEIERIRGLSQCSDGWVSYNMSCYHFSLGNKTFADASKTCHSKGAYLVYVENEAENNFLKNFLRTLKGKRYWLGLTDLASEGTWLFIETNAIPTFFDWTTNEPNNLDNEDCVEFQFNSDFQWNDVGCSMQLGYICEQSKL